MATLAGDAPVGARQDRYFLVMALMMAAVMVAGFSLHLAMGRSSFSVPWVIHAHALVAFGWIVIFVTQTWLGTTGSIVLHRRLGWIAAGWAIVMVGMAITISIYNVRMGRVPFFFLPQYFVLVNPLGALAFGALTWAAIRNRKRTDWHKRLHFSAMAMILGPGFGRLLPLPLMGGWGFQISALAGLVFPIAGMIIDYRRDGRVHPAWWWGVGTLLAVLVIAELLAPTPIGAAWYAFVTAGSPGAGVPGLEFPPPPPGA